MDIEDEVFKFIIEKPREEISIDQTYSSIHIYMKSPHFVFDIKLNPTQDRALQERVAMAELKLAMVKAVVDGTWEKK